MDVGLVHRQRACGTSPNMKTVSWQMGQLIPTRTQARTHFLGGPHLPRIWVSKQIIFRRLEVEMMIIDVFIFVSWHVLIFL